MRMYGMLLGTLLTGCAAPDLTVEPEDTEESQTSTSVVSASLVGEGRALLFARLNPSRVRLVPAVQVAEAQAFDPAVLTSALEAATGSAFEGSWSGATWTGVSPSHRASFDTETGSLLVEDDSGYELGLAHAEDALLLAKASALFNSVATDAATALVEVKHLGATHQQAEGLPQQEDARVGSKVFAFRTLGGLRVAGNRMVASFKTDGTLRTVRGRWPAIDLTRSQLSSSLRVDEVVERALDVLLEANVRTVGADPIAVETFYELRTMPDGQHVAVLRASALVQTLGPDGSNGRAERHDFDL